MFFVKLLIFFFITLLTTATDTSEEFVWPVPGILMTYNEALERCFNNSSLPYIPPSPERWNLIITANDNERLQMRGGGYYSNLSFWLPATDRGHEGQLRWYNGADATAAPIGWIYNETLYENSSDNNCVVINTKSKGRRAYMAPCTTRSQAMTCVKNTSIPDSTDIKDIAKDRTHLISTVDETTVSMFNYSNETNKEKCNFSSLPWILAYCLGVSTCVLLVALICVIKGFKRIKNDSSIRQGSTVAECQELKVIQDNEQN
ncbi:unnamed protein product [Meganyctiphanes norvegica]|uniref:C-type lectin domain-containing protein n=1 Tax=Meganyctiphanes norvegica TaxID=48144 RepID=A0AAV2QBR1_MEGNR